MNRFSFIIIFFALFSTVTLAQISVNTTGLATLSSCSGQASSNTSVSVSGTTLTSAITVTAPYGFEVSTAAGSGFATSLNLNPSSGTVSATTVYIRLADYAPNGSNTGNVVCSSSGKTSTSTAVSGTVNVTFPNGNALDFQRDNSSSGDYVQTAHNAVMNTNTLTMEAWVKPRSISAGELYTVCGTLRHSGSDLGYSLGIFNNQIWFALGQSWNNWGDLYGTTVLNSNEWYHLSATFDGSTMKVYLNGKLEASKSYTVSIIHPNQGFFIGNRSNLEHPFHGAIDEVRLWNVVRTDAQIRDNYNKTISGSSSGLIAYYNFNNGTASSNNAGLTSLTDLSSTGLTGTLYTFALTGSTSNWVAAATPAVSGATTLCAGGGTSTYTTTASGGTWSSSNTAVATVNASTGVVTPVAAGTASIIYTYTSGSCSLTPSLPITVSAGPTVATTTPASRCSSGNVTISATASSAGATLTWYALASGGTALGTGTNYTASNLSSTTTYYVDATENGCTSARTAVTATVLPALPVITPLHAKQCGTGNVDLMATATNMSDNSMRWYDAATGGNLQTGVTHPANGFSYLSKAFLPGQEGTTMTYYVEAQNACGTSARTAVNAVSYILPSTPTASGGTRCGSGAVTLSATLQTDMGFRWYPAASTTLLSTGNSYSPTVSTTTDFRVQAYNTISEAAGLSCGSQYTTVTATVSNAATWSGTGNWSDAAYWSCGSVPGEGADITVSSGTVTLPADVTLAAGDAMTVQSGAVVEITEAITLTIDPGATLVNDGVIRLNSSGSSVANLWLKGTYSNSSSGTVAVEHAYDVSNSTEPWVQVASPVSGSMISFGSASNNNAYSWDANNAAWVAEAGANSLQAGKGYTLYIGTNGVQTATSGVLEVQGVPFSNPTLTFGYHNGVGNGLPFASTDANLRRGWNFLGNPFTSRLDFTAFRATANNDFNNSFARWNPTKGGAGNGGFDVYAGASADYTDASIPPMGAAWIQVKQGNSSAPSLSGALSHANHGRKNGGTFSKGAGVDKLKIVVSELASPTISDELSLAMVPGASDGFDSDWDGRELLNGTNMPNLFVHHLGDRISAKAVDFGMISTQAKVVEVGMKSIFEMRPYRLHLDETWTQPGYTVYLKDLHLSQYHNLSASDYVFAYVGSMEDRFELILTNAKTGALGLEEASRGALTAWVSGSELWITGMESGAQEIDVVGMDGGVLHSAQLRAEEGEPVTTALPELPAGLYTVRVRANGMERGVRFAVQR